MQLTFSVSAAVLPSLLLLLSSAAALPHSSVTTSSSTTTSLESTASSSSSSSALPVVDVDPSKTLPLSVPRPSPSSFASPDDADFPPSIEARDPTPTDCQNSGTGNTGCNNSGINNSGTNNSGIGNCGTNHSGIGEGCDDGNGGTMTIAPGSTATAGGGYTTTLTGPTSTVTVVVAGDSNSRRTDCAYWEAQGYTCDGAGALVRGMGGFALMVASLIGLYLAM